MKKLLTKISDSMHEKVWVRLECGMVNDRTSWDPGALLQLPRSEAVKFIENGTAIRALPSEIEFHLANTDRLVNPALTEAT